MNGTAWTPEEIETLRELRAVRGWDCPAIAATLGRTDNSVSKKAASLCITLPPTRKRGSTNDDEALREAFNAGAAIKHVAKALGMEKRCVAMCYERLSAQLIAAGPDYFHTGGYMGAKEMARIVAPVCGAPARAILSESRYRPAVLGRMAIARALRDRGISMTAIARTLGRADHTTILNNLAKFDTYARTYPRLLQAYEAIKEAECAALVRLAA